MDKHVFFRNARGQQLSGLLSFPKHSPQPPVVIISHGFLSYKENKLLYYIARSLEQNGIAAFRFDFAGCVGESEGGCREMMLSHQITDLTAAVDIMARSKIINPNQIGLVGHSLGGLTSLLVAGNDERIRSLVSIAAPARLEWQQLITPEAGKLWEHDQVAYFKSDRKGDVAIDFSFYKDFSEFDGLACIRKRRFPVRIIHGTKDNVVALKNAEKLNEYAPGKKDLCIIEGGDHNFLKSPFTEQVAEKTLRWMVETLLSSSPGERNNLDVHTF